MNITVADTETATFSAGIAMEAAENEINEKCVQFFIVVVKAN
jgi:hypothetical protein